MYATLVNVHHLPVEQIRKLTDRQIAMMYFHPRNKDGAIEARDDERVKKQTLESELMDIDCLGMKLKWKTEDTEKLKNEIREKWRTKTTPCHQN